MARSKKPYAAPRVETMEVEEREISIADLILTYTEEDNPNRMDPEAFLGLCESIKQNGFLQPILVRRDTDGSLWVVDGHHRVHASTRADRKTIKAVVVSNVTAAVSRALGIGLNRYRGDQVLTRTAEILAEVANEGSIGKEELAVMAGFSAKALDVLLAANIETPELELPDNERAGSQDEGGAAKPFVLEIRFESKEEYALAKRKLTKASGTTKDLAVGLLTVLGEARGGS